MTQITLAIEVLEEILEVLAECTIIIFEYTGVIIMAIAAVRGIIELICRRGTVRLHLGQWMGTGLQFLMGAEILKTVITHDLLDLAALGALVIMRTVLAFVVHWETSHEEHKAEHDHENEIKDGENPSAVH